MDGLAAVIQFFSSLFKAPGKMISERKVEKIHNLNFLFTTAFYIEFIPFSEYMIYPCSSISHIRIDLCSALHEKQ